MSQDDLPTGRPWKRGNRRRPKEVPIPDFVDGPEPLLPPGVHQATIEEIQASLVTGFPTSVTRQRIASNWIAFGRVFRTYLPVKQEFIDGSFVTGRQNPQDLDHSLWIDADDLVSLAGDRLQAFQGFWSRRLDAFGCDAHLVPECTPGHKLYGVFVQERNLTEAAWPRYQNLVREIVAGVQKGYLEVVP
jgi:hypothetical protein